jgi:tetratricopeptide (TPR) repeat protein
LNETYKCDEISNFIFFPNDLDNQQKEKLNKHLQSCAECKKLYKNIDKIRIGIYDHIDDELLSEFIENEKHNNEKDYISHKVSDKDIKMIKEHLDFCNMCGSKYKERQLIYSELNEHLENFDFLETEIRPFLIEKTKIPSMLISQIKQLIQDIHFNKKIVYGSLITVVLFFAILTNLDSKKPTIEDLAYINEIEIPVSTRGGTSDNLQKAIFLFNDKMYSKSIILLEKIVDNDSINKEYAQYLLSLSYLMLATKNDEIRQSLIDKAIYRLNSLQEVINNTNLKENVLWYLGKAYLLNKDISKAATCFEKIYKLDAYRSPESQIILKQLKEIE